MASVGQSLKTKTDGKEYKKKIIIIILKRFFFLKLVALILFFFKANEVKNFFFKCRPIGLSCGIAVGLGPLKI